MLYGLRRQMLGQCAQGVEYRRTMSAAHAAVALGEHDHGTL